MTLDVDRYLGRFTPPSYSKAEELIGDCLPSLAPPRRISVPDWAEDERVLNTPSYSGPWRNDFAPYMVEPSKMTTSRKYGAVVFVGPARTVKTDSLILNTLGHRVRCMPRDMLIVGPTKDAAREFSITKIGPFLRSNRVVADRMLKGSDNTYDKAFLGNMRVRFGWPVIGQLSMVDIPDVAFTDYDRMPDDVDGEGAPFDLGRKRNQTFGSLGMTIAESSPGRLIERDDWKPETPHEAPPTTGILALYNSGTRAQRYWNCPQCEEDFRPRFECLQWEERDTHGEAAKTVTLGCPECGFPIPPSMKGDLERAGKWLHETGDGSELVEIGHPDIRDTDVVSYWCEGPIAAMQSWQQLVQRHLDALSDFNRTGDETRLKATVTLDQGRPYLPRIRTLGDGLSEEALKALAKRYPLGVLPEETRFVTVAVDVQAARFVVQVEAWGEGLEHWLVDRFDISNPPATSPGAEHPDGRSKRSIDPGRYAEDWTALDDLLEQVWPVAGQAHGLTARGLIVDSGGAPGVTANAYAFWRRHKKEGRSGRVFLAKGSGGISRDRAAYVSPEKVEGTKQKRRTDIRLVRVGTDPLKDEITLALTRKDGGPGAYHLSELLEVTVFAEFCAEARTPKGWEVRRSGLRNESLDLAVYAKALVIVLKGEKINWDAPPSWAIAGASNLYAKALRKSVEPVAAKKEKPALKPRARRGSGFVKRSF